MRAKAGTTGMVGLLVMAICSSTAWAAVINVPADQATIQAAINAASAGDTINVAAGTYSGNLSVTVGVTLQSASGAAVTTIQGAGGCAVAINADGVTIDGFTITNPTGANAICAADRSSILIKNNIITNIGATTVGGNHHAIAVSSSALAVSGVTIEDNKISNVVGSETAAKGSASGMTIGFSTGAENITGVLIQRNTISNIKANIASFATGGRGAYGILINHGTGVTGKTVGAQVLNNTITDLEGLWAHGVGLEGNTPNALVQRNNISFLVDHKAPSDAVGVQIEDNASAATVGIHLNSFTNLNVGVQNVAAAAVVDATNNWWGGASGPADPNDDTFETTNVGTAGCTGDPATESNPSGTGSSVVDNSIQVVDYCPFLCGPATLEFKLATGSDCVKPGETIQVELHQLDLTSLVAGFQAFSQFDNSVMAFNSGTYTSSPYGSPLISPITDVGNNIDMASGINNLGGQMPTTADALLVTLTFTAGGTDGPTTVSFRPHAPPSWFTDPVGGQIVPCLVQSPTIIIDGTPPVITCPVDATVECDADSSPAGAAGMATATDNLDPNPAITSSDTVVVGTCPQESVITRTWTATDCAGNFSTCVQTITVVDTTAPVIACPANVTVECDADSTPTGTGTGTATDNCDPTPVITFTDSVAAGACAQESVIARTWKATDCVGNFSTCDQIITVVDTTPPVITFCPPDVTLECDQVTSVLTLGPGIPFGTATGGVAVYYNNNNNNGMGGNGENPLNQAFFKAQFDGTKDIAGGTNGGAYLFDNSPLTGSSSFSWQDLYSGLVFPASQFGLDFVLPLPTNDGSVPPPVLNAYDNGDNSVPGRILVGPVTWAINDYKGPSNGPANAANDVINSLIRSQSPGIPAIDVEIIQLDLTQVGPIFTQQIGGKLVSDGTNHWFGLTTPDSPLANFALNGDFYFSGTLTYDSTGDLGTDLIDFFAGTITITANAPNATGIALATDNCDPLPVISFSDDTSGLTGCDGTGTIVRTWTATDACGNAVSCSQSLFIVDTTPPVITCPSDATVECDADSSPTGTGAATSIDNCDGSPAITSSDVSTQTSDGSCTDSNYTITRTWTATDACGNSSTCDQIITVVDTTAPVLTPCPADIMVNADAGVCTAVVTWTDPTALDNCDPAPTVVCVPASGSTFSPGLTVVTCTATDACGNSSQCTFNVTVSGSNEMVVNIDLQATVAAGSFTRCITFELWNCPDTTPAATVNEVMTFTGGSTSATVLVPCGTYTCVTARDKLHTLRRTLDMPAFAIVGTQYDADFAFAGKDLIGGNLNDDFFIDILDFGVFSSQFNMSLAASTTCTTTGPHSDISGDGVVTTGDFTFIQQNFLLGHEANCCGQPLFASGEGGSGPVTEITVAELRAQGLGDLAAGDLNHDGVLNQSDIVEFMMGTRPSPRPHRRPIQGEIRKAPLGG